MFSLAGEGKSVVKEDAAYGFVRGDMRQAVAADALTVEIKSLQRNDALAHEFAVNDKCYTRHSNNLVFAGASPIVDLG